MERKFVINARKALGLKQSDLSKQVGCSQELISKAERGLPVRVETAKRISAVLGLDWTQFYTDEPDNESPTTTLHTRISAGGT